MITAFLGIPGSGKTSVLTLIAQKELKRIEKGKSPYKHVYTSFYCLGCEKLNFSDLGIYYFHDSLILLDEMTLLNDSRDWKNMSEDLKQFVILHRHFHCDIIYTVQDWSRCEKTMRENTQLLFYLSLIRLPFFKIAHSRRIFRHLTINEYSSEIVLGYRFPEGLDRFSGKHFYNLRKAFKYYDSFEKHGFDHKPVPPARRWQPSSGSDGLPRLTAK